MLTVTDVYRPQEDNFELRPFQDRVLELVRLFEASPAVRLRVVGTIAAGAPIEAPGEPEEVTVRSPLHAARRHRDLHGLRRYLCPALQSASGDAFQIARVITPLLAGLQISGKVPIDLDPWLFAGISLLIARMGVASFCAGDEDNDDAAEGQEVGAETEQPRAGGQDQGHAAPTMIAGERGPNRNTARQQTVERL